MLSWKRPNSLKLGESSDDQRRNYPAQNRGTSGSRFQPAGVRGQLAGRLDARHGAAKGRHLPAFREQRGTGRGGRGLNLGGGLSGPRGGGGEAVARRREGAAR